MWDPLPRFNFLQTKALCLAYCRGHNFNYISQSVLLFAIIGCALIAYSLYSLIGFLYFYLLRPSSLSRYRHHPNGSKSRPWALITGASDGIGKGFAEELSSRGFNIVLHGRNETKLNRVKTELEAQQPDAQFRLAVLDAAEANDVGKIENLAAELNDLHITVLINNVGGSGPVRPMWQALHKRSREEVDQLININLRFATHLTRLMLPSLLRNTPSLVINIGSVSAQLPSPWLTIYAGGKAFNLAWSRSLNVEMQAEGKDVEVLGALVGQVQTQHYEGDASFFAPSSRTFVRAALGVVGCGRATVIPYIGHAVQLGMVAFLPERLLNKMLIKVTRTAISELSKLQ